MGLVRFHRQHLATAGHRRGHATNPSLITPLVRLCEATAQESREQIIDLYHRAWTHSDATIDTLALDATGHVPWWPPDRREVTLHRILVHMIAETDRHAGQADIVRELIDGAAGRRAGNDNMPSGDQAWWERYRDQVEQAAQLVGSA